MKIRSKLMLLEGGLTLILFSSLMLSIFTLINSFAINSANQSALDASYTTKVLRINLEELIYDPTVQYENYQILVSLWESVDQLSSVMYEQKMKNDFDGETVKIVKNLEYDWSLVSKDDPIPTMNPYFKNYFTYHRKNLMSFNTYVKTFNPKEPRENLLRIKELIAELKQREVYYSDLLNSLEENIPIIQKNKIMWLYFWNLIAVLLVLFLSLVNGKRLIERIHHIRYSLEQISRGEFSHKIIIRTDDEFGKVARDFNTVTAALWAKLESVQSILRDVGDSISHEIEIEKVQKAIVNLALKGANADGAALYLFNENNTALELFFASGDFRPPYILGEEREEVAPFRHSQERIESFQDYHVPLVDTVIGDTATKGQPFFIKRAYSSSFARPKNHPYHINSAITLPIRVGNKVLGVMALLHTDEEYFSDLEFANAQSFGELAAISIDNLMKYNEMLEVSELNREIDIAAEIQQNLLPQIIPDLRNTDLAFSTRTCRGINGDFYDCYMVDKENVLITLCEVAGKGVPAALVITMLKTILKLVSTSSKNSAKVIEELNRSITERIRIENIASMGLIIFNQNTGELSYASAGEKPLLLYRGEEEKFEEFQPQGIPVGLDKAAKYTEKKVTLSDKDFLVLFTDGVPEALSRTGHEYGLKSLKHVCEKRMELSAKDMIQEIFDDLDSFLRKSHQWDDQTALILKRGGQK